MARIERMTEEQAAALPAFREAWRQVGLSTDPVQPEAARRAVRDLYRAGGRGEPAAVVVLASPMACLIARGLVQALTRSNLSDNQRLAIELKLGDQLGGQLRDQLGGQLRDQLCDQLGGQLWGQLRDQLGDQLWGQNLYQAPWMTGGQDAYWLSFAEYGERIGASYRASTKSHFEAYKAYALTSGWLFPYETIAFVSDRPAELHWDDGRRLHNPAGMAVRFRDGWGVYAWHGTRVPAWVIEEPTKLTVPAMLHERNQELKRVMAEMIGPERRLAETMATLVHEDECGKLWRSRIGDEDWLEVEVVNGSTEPDGTRRRYFLDVTCAEEQLGWPIKTARAAVAATYGLRAEEYRGLVVRT